MLNRLIQWALRNRVLVIIACVLVLAGGGKVGRELPVEVLPDLTNPTVTVLLEAPGLAPEEVEAQVIVPVENALMGIAGLSRLRTSSDIALGVDQQGAGDQGMMFGYATNETREMLPVPLTKGTKLSFEPGKKHLMAMDVDPALKAGGKTEATIIVSGGGRHTFPVEIRAAGDER